jgi:hypothetical protein
MHSVEGDMGRSFFFSCETELEKTTWLREITLCWLGLQQDEGIELQPGYQHEFLLGTWFSAAKLGNMEVTCALYGKWAEYYHSSERCVNVNCRVYAMKSKCIFISLLPESFIDSILYHHLSVSLQLNLFVPITFFTNWNTARRLLNPRTRTGNF